MPLIQTMSKIFSVSPSQIKKESCTTFRSAPSTAAGAMVGSEVRCSFIGFTFKPLCYCKRVLSIKVRNLMLSRSNTFCVVLGTNERYIHWHHRQFDRTGLYRHEEACGFDWKSMWTNHAWLDWSRKFHYSRYYGHW